MQLKPETETELREAVNKTIKEYLEYGHNKRLAFRLEELTSQIVKNLLKARLNTADVDVCAAIKLDSGYPDYLKNVSLYIYRVYKVDDKYVYVATLFYPNGEIKTIAYPLLDELLDKLADIKYEENL